MVRLPIQIFSVFILIKLFENEIIFKYEKFIYYLSVISLFFFIWQIIFPESLYWITSNLNFNSGDEDYYERIKSNILIYTVNHSPEWDLPRNAGFCWEPGPFGCFIVVAMYFNMIRNNFKTNKIYWILLITLLTTQSTTAIISFIILFIWIIVNNNMYRRLLFYIVPIVFVILLLIFTGIPFLKDKIIEDFSQSDDTEQVISRSASSGDGYAPGRFVSFQITYQDFIERPLLGYGGKLDLQWTRQLGAFIYPVSGFGNILANFGLFGFFCWLLIIIKSGNYLKKYNNNYLFGIIWFLLVISISIGFMIVISPIFLAFYFLPYFRKVDEFENANL
jgi:hypothetical protein